MTDDFIRYNVSVLLKKNGTRAKNPIVHEGCCLALSEDKLLLVTRDSGVLFDLICASAFPQACGIKITGLERYWIGGCEAFRHQELWCWMPIK